MEERLVPRQPAVADRRQPHYAQTQANGDALLNRLDKQIQVWSIAGTWDFAIEVDMVNIEAEEKAVKKKSWHCLDLFTAPFVQYFSMAGCHGFAFILCIVMAIRCCFYFMCSTYYSIALICGSICIL